MRADNLRARGDWRRCVVWEQVHKSAPSRRRFLTVFFFFFFSWFSRFRDSMNMLQRAADLYQAATATAVEADVVRQLNLLSLTHRRAAETLRSQFESAGAAAAASSSSVGDDSESSGESDGAPPVVDLNELLASKSADQDDFHVVSHDDDDNDDDEEDDEDSFVGVRAPPPAFVEQAPTVLGAEGEPPHSMWSSFERLVGRVMQVSAKMLAESAGLDAQQQSESTRQLVEAELAKLPRKSSSDSLTDEFKEFVDVRVPTPDPLAHHRSAVISADASRSSSPSQLNASAANVTAGPSRSDTPSVGCTSVDDMQLVLRQLGDALRKTLDDDGSAAVGVATLQNAISALRNAVSWRRRLTLLQTHNEQLHAAVSHLNAEVLRRAQEARVASPAPPMYASALVGAAAPAGETARLQSEVALLRRQLSSVLSLTANRTRQGSPSRSPVKGKQAPPVRRASRPVPMTTVTPPPAAGEAKRTPERERPKSVTFNVPDASGGGGAAAPAGATAAPAAAADASTGEASSGFSERARLTSSEPLIERESSPSSAETSKATGGAGSSEASTPPNPRAGAATPPLPSAAALKQQLLAGATLTSSCDD